MRVHFTFQTLPKLSVEGVDFIVSFIVRVKTFCAAESMNLKIDLNSRRIFFFLLKLWATKLLRKQPNSAKPAVRSQRVSRPSSERNMKSKLEEQSWIDTDRKGLRGYVRACGFDRGSEAAEWLFKTRVSLRLFSHDHLAKSGLVIVDNDPITTSHCTRQPLALHGHRQRRQSFQFAGLEV